MTEMFDMTPVIKPNGASGEEVRIDEMTGAQLAASLPYYARSWYGDLLRSIHAEFLEHGGQPHQRVADLVEVSPRTVYGPIQSIPQREESGHD
jgi:hypothetical protein